MIDYRPAQRHEDEERRRWWCDEHLSNWSQQEFFQNNQRIDDGKNFTTNKDGAVRLHVLHRTQNHQNNVSDGHSLPPDMETSRL